MFPFNQCAGRYFIWLASILVFDQSNLHIIVFWTHIHLIDTQCFKTSGAITICIIIGALQQWNKLVHAEKYFQLPGSWIRCKGLTPWPPRSPDLSLSVFFFLFFFFFWNFAKDYVYTPPMPQSLADLWGWISDVTAQVNAAILQCTLEEFHYCLDIYHVSHGVHSEHIQGKLKNITANWIFSHFGFNVKPVNKSFSICTKWFHYCLLQLIK